MESMEDRFLIPKEEQPDLRRRVEHGSPFFASFRSNLLLFLFIFFTLYIYNLVSTPDTISSSWLFRHHKGFVPHGHNKDCESKDFKAETLKLIMEFPFAGLFFHRQIPRYEASDVIIANDTAQAFVVFDNSFSIARVGPPHMFHLRNITRGPPRSPPQLASLLEWPGDTGGLSQFEFIAYNESAGTYIVGQETVTHDDGKQRAAIYDVTFNDTSTIVGTRCVTDMEFASANKGFEGAVFVTTKQGESLLVGLCEGNRCKAHHEGRKAGHGRLVVMRRVTREGECWYETVDTVKLPDKVDFEDYSGITVWKETTVAITSQENAAVFVGTLDLDGGVKVKGGKVLDFPRNDKCEIKYCNIEGVAFVDDKTIVVVSDSMKSQGRQHFRCREKDESIHIFRLP